MPAASTFVPGDAGAILNLVNEGVSEGLDDWAGRVLSSALAIVPVRTGELRDSGHIEAEDAGNVQSRAVVFDAPHAVFVEFGTVKMAAQPFLRPALDEHEVFAGPVVQEAVNKRLA